MTPRLVQTSGILATVIIALTAAVLVARWTPKAAPTALAPVEKPKTVSPLGSVSDILGLRIGDTMEEAHEKLDALRDPAAGEAAEVEGGEEEGVKAFCQLKATEYRWVMLWANTAERIVAIQVSVRPERLKPFAEIGDLNTAATHRPELAAWNVTPPKGLPYRVIAKGAQECANAIYITSSTLDVR